MKGGTDHHKNEGGNDVSRDSFASVLVEANSLDRCPRSFERHARIEPLVGDETRPKKEIDRRALQP